MRCLSRLFEPREFLVTGPVPAPLSDPASALAQLQQLVDLLSTPPTVNESPKAVADLVTDIWRWAGRMGKLMDGKSGVDERALRPLRSALNIAQDTLRRHRIEIRDYVNDVYDPGNPPRVIGRHDDPSMGPEDSHVVHQTVKPTLLRNGALIQEGEIIVRCPPVKGREAGGAGAE